MARVLLQTIPQAPRQGTVESASWQVPNLQGGSLEFELNLRDQDRSNPALSINLRFYFLRDNGDGTQTWVQFAGGTWEGDPNFIPNEPNNWPVPVFATGAEVVRGKTVKVGAEILVQFRVGASIFDVR